MPERQAATLLGFGAVLLWALLALLTVWAAPVPPFLLTALAFSVGGSLGLFWMLATGQLGVVRTIPAGAWALGVGGLFGYHALYFTALRLLPPAEASLLAYLWPLLIVLFSGLLPGERLGLGHVAGAMLAFAGAALLILAPGEGVGLTSLPGLAAALACALTWSGYSVLSRRYAGVPTAAVAPFCVAAAGLSFALHALLEPPVWPRGGAWFAVLGLGLGPVGLAFFLWDVGVKRGNIQLLGTLSYAAPLLSTLVLIAAGIAAAHPRLILAALLIAGGAALAARAGPASKPGTA